MKVERELLEGKMGGGLNLMPLAEDSPPSSNHQDEPEIEPILHPLRPKPTQPTQTKTPTQQHNTPYLPNPLQADEDLIFKMLSFSPLDTSCDLGSLILDSTFVNLNQIDPDANPAVNRSVIKKYRVFRLIAQWTKFAALNVAKQNQIEQLKLESAEVTFLLLDRIYFLFFSSWWINLLSLMSC